jgi:predicted nucleotidyltransferase
MTIQKIVLISLFTIVCISLISMVIWLLVKNKRDKWGKGQSQKVLIKTLKHIVKILNNSDITWAVAFGTLLGLKREGNPIANDDDIDILVPIEEREKLVKLVRNHGLKIGWSSKIMIKIENKGFAPIDFYFTKQYNKNGYDVCVLHDPNPKGFPVKSFPIKSIQWKGLKVNIPQGDIRLLNDNYKTWRKPTNSKGYNIKRPHCKY